MKGVLPQSRQSARLFLQSFELGPPPAPSPVGECVPPLWFRGGGGGGTRSLAGEGWGPNCDKGTDTVVLLVYMNIVGPSLVASLGL